MSALTYKNYKEFTIADGNTQLSIFYELIFIRKVVPTHKLASYESLVKMFDMCAISSSVSIFVLASFRSRTVKSDQTPVK